MRLFIFVLIVNVLNLWVFFMFSKKDWYFNHPLGFVPFMFNLLVMGGGILGLIFSLQRLVNHPPPYLTYAINWLLEC